MLLPETDKPKTAVPSAFPVSRQEFYAPRPIGRGTRMVAYPSYAGMEVLRVPFRTEADLVQQFGESGSYATSTKEHPVSQYTIDEIRRYTRMNRVLGQYTIGVVPFQDFDADGQVRTYSTQRKIEPRWDLLLLPRILDKLDGPTKKQIADFIIHVRMMVAAQGWILDLNGTSNTVIDKHGDVCVIDVNNIRPVISDDSWLNPEFRGKEAEVEKMMRRYKGLRCLNVSGEPPEEIRRIKGIIEQCRAELRQVFAPGHWDERDLPIGDLSMMTLSNWELALGMQTQASLKTDMVHAVCMRDPFRRKILRHSDLSIGDDEF